MFVALGLLVAPGLVDTLVRAPKAVGSQALSLQLPNPHITTHTHTHTLLPHPNLFIMAPPPPLPRNLLHSSAARSHLGIAPLSLLPALPSLEPCRSSRLRPPSHPPT